MKRFLTAFLLTKLAIALINALIFPRLKRAAPVAKPRVSVLIPARNEAENLSKTLPLLLSQQATEVLVLDDQSEDETAEVVRGLQKDHPQLKLIAGSPLPAGWVGKNWACHQLSLAARGDLLVFTDADVFWHAGSLKAVLTRMQESHADLLSVYPRQETHTLSERALVPLIDDVLLCFFPYLFIRLPFAAASAGNGQVMVFRRESYQRISGHAGVRKSVLEDVDLARRIKKHGGKLSLALGQDLISVRMYHGYQEVLEGFGKNLRAFHGNKVFFLLLSGFLHLSAYTLPLLVPAFRPLLWMGLAERLVVNLTSGRNTRADLLEVFTVPISPLLSLPIYWRALQKKYNWKGRHYSR
ncbi:glycosyltransferase [Deinococcus cellulosilyticus]|uniref:Glycosyltransferase 2-like domain-containing protein n=1 Tax=Deinococcus cellulosilyticus (strain DSM 18568 / NBRC 106333 / KACC 11606 / 5516J-15) TaxID=1223518 RepID=A0A511N6N1_DEIC1|nr:glycosyltransferase [Deinococcus cellulosilyticus]GEM48513.1 hypothetical protein DC3_41480 [Deinococcus cellulosilyticus NBRC 106333 = KACC 11606]